MARRPRGWHVPALDLLLGLALGLACLTAVFPRAVWRGGSLVPSAALWQDPVFQGEDAFHGQRRGGYWDPSGALVHYPAEEVAAWTLRAGHAPLWNPYLGAGTPLLAEAHSAPLSPLLLPFDAAPSQSTWSWAILLRVLISIAGTFLVARARGLSGAASTLAAIVYSIGGYFAARYDLPTEGAAHAMLPWCLLAADAVVARRRTLAAVGALALGVGAAIFMAHPEPAALAGGGAALIALCSAPMDRRAWARLGAGVALGGAVGAAVAGPLLGYLVSGGASYKTDPKLLAMFPPDIKMLDGAPDMFRLGAAALALACTGFLAGNAVRTATKRAAFGALVLVVGLYLFQLWAPAGLTGIVQPRYTIFLLVFTMALLAAETLDALVRGDLRVPILAWGVLLAAVVWWELDRITKHGFHVRDIWLGDLVALGTLAAAAWALSPGRVRRELVPWLLVAVTGVTLIVSTRRVVGKSGAGIPESRAVEALRRFARPPLRIAGLGADWHDTPLIPDLAGAYGLSDVRAIQAVFPARYRGYMNLVDGVTDLPTMVLVERVGSPLLDLLGVAYVLTPPLQAPPGWPVVYQDASVIIARNPTAVPRVFVPRTLVAAPNAATSLITLGWLAQARRTPWAAVVEAPPTVLEHLGGGAGGGRAEPRIVEYYPWGVTIDVAAEGASLIVLSDAWDSGWRATVDGTPAPIYPVDHLFRGVAVEAGRHRIVMTYEPRSWTIGLRLSLAATAVALALIAAGFLRRRAAV